MPASLLSLKFLDTLEFSFLLWEFESHLLNSLFDFWKLAQLWDSTC